MLLTVNPIGRNVRDVRRVVMPTFNELYERATGYEPYGYQARIARDGLPSVVRAATGTGKTGVILAWLWRRLYRPHPAETPRRLVYALPQRSLLDQVAGESRADRERRAARGHGRTRGDPGRVAREHAPARHRDRNRGFARLQGAEPGIRDRAGDLPDRLRAGHQRRPLDHRRDPDVPGVHHDAPAARRVHGGARDRRAVRRDMHVGLRAR